MGILDWVFGATGRRTKWKPMRSSERSGSVEPLHLARGQGYDFEVVGESHAQDVLDRFCGGKCEDGHDLEVIAQLLLIEGNPYDPDAVGVFLGGELAGYIPRHLARQFRSNILRLSPDERPVTCDAKIVGGWHRGDDDQGHYGLRLSLSGPLTLRVES